MEDSARPRATATSGPPSGTAGPRSTVEGWPSALMKPIRTSAAPSAQDGTCWLCSTLSAFERAAEEARSTSDWSSEEYICIRTVA